MYINQSSISTKPQDLSGCTAFLSLNLLKKKIYGSEYIDLSALLLTNPAAKQGTQTLLFKGVVLLFKLKLSLQVR
jgi:hypothetical protein